jgi:monoamine oxidase
MQTALNTTREGTLVKGQLTTNGLPTLAAVEGTPAVAVVYDAIVVGAGFAGLTAARDLAKAGRKVLIVEARDRIGGRTYSAHVDGHLYEMGGTWIHWSQPFVWTEICRYGMDLIETEANRTPLAAVYGMNDGVPGVIDADGQFERLKELMKLYMNVDGYEGRRVFPRGPDTFFNPMIAEFDELSMEGRLAQLDIPDSDRNILRTRFNANPTDPAKAGFVDLLRWWALCDYDVKAMADRFNRYKIKDGMTGLALNILKDGGADILLSSPVDGITERDGIVAVSIAGGRTITANHVVVAMPLNLLHTVSFEPGLEPLKAEAAKEGHPSKNAKFHIRTRSKPGNIAARTIWPYPLVSFLTDAIEGDDTYVVGFTRGGMVDLGSVEEVRKQVQTFVPDLEIDTMLSHDWTNDPYSRGAHGMYGPGQLTRFLKALQRPAGNIHFAGSDWSDGWRGYVDGAIQSGMETAKKIIGGGL